MRSADWQPFAERRLKKSNIILHTDGARAYKLKVEGVLHDHVVHKRKRLTKKNGQLVKRNGKPVWIKPKYVKQFSHFLPDGKRLQVQGGTQIIDRFWGHLRKFMKHSKAAVGSLALRRLIRAGQWTYWYKGKDLWLKTGDMLEDLR